MEQELDKYTSPRSLLYVDGRGTLRRLYCPFKVKCLIAVDSFRPGEVLQVNQVRMDAGNVRIIYLIQNKAVVHSYFTLVVS